MLRTRVTLGLAAVFLTLAIPVQLGLHGITLAWAVEGVLLLWLGNGPALAAHAGLRLRRPALAVGRLFVRHLPLHPAPVTPFVNPVFGLWLAVIVALVAAQALVRRVPDDDAVPWLDGSRDARPRPAGPRAPLRPPHRGDELGLLARRARGDSRGRRRGGRARGPAGRPRRLGALDACSRRACWPAGLGLRSRPLFYAAYALFAVTAGKVVLVDLATLPTLYRMLSFLALGVLLLAGAWLNLRFRERLTGPRGVALRRSLALALAGAASRPESRWPRRLRRPSSGAIARGGGGARGGAARPRRVRGRAGGPRRPARARRAGPGGAVRDRPSDLSRRPRGGRPARGAQPGLASRRRGHRGPRLRRARRQAPARSCASPATTSGAAWRSRAARTGRRGRRSWTRRGSSRSRGPGPSATRRWTFPRTTSPCCAWWSRPAPDEKARPAIEDALRAGRRPAAAPRGAPRGPLERGAGRAEPARPGSPSTSARGTSRSTPSRSTWRTSGSSARSSSRRGASRGRRVGRWGGRRSAGAASTAWSTRGGAGSACGSRRAAASGRCASACATATTGRCGSVASSCGRAGRAPAVRGGRRRDVPPHLRLGRPAGARPTTSRAPSGDLERVGRGGAAGAPGPGPSARRAAAGDDRPWTERHPSLLWARPPGRRRGARRR